LLYKFKDLWLLVEGLKSGLGMMFYVVALLFCILYVFGCVGIEIITKNGLVGKDEEFTLVVENNFESLPGSMLTLMQFIAMDSVAAVYTPLIKKDIFLAVYFVAIILIVSVVLMNLVTAIIVQAAFDQTSRDVEAKKAYENDKMVRLVHELETLCYQFDQDGSGKVSLKEIQSDPEALETFNDLVSHGGKLDAEDLFHILGARLDEEIAIGDLVLGLLEVILFEGPIEILWTQKTTLKLEEKVSHIESRVDLIYALLAEQRHLNQKKHKGVVIVSGDDEEKGTATKTFTKAAKDAAKSFHTLKTMKTQTALGRDSEAKREKHAKLKAKVGGSLLSKVSFRTCQGIALRGAVFQQLWCRRTACLAC